MSELNVNDYIAKYTIDYYIIHAKNCPKCQATLQDFLNRMDCKDFAKYYNKILKV